MVLFDMDGTLTEARGKITQPMAAALCELSKLAHIGIVTGSGIDYVEEQCAHTIAALFKEGALDSEKFILFPCNGTQVYSWKNEWHNTFDISMEESLGSNFKKLIKLLLKLQYQFAVDPDNSDVPLVGHFISYRGPMINWCPLGRDANFSYREDFVIKDKKRNIRKNLYAKLNRDMKRMGINDVTAALGGNTSIDIYPTGWDKSFVLQHLQGDKAWFVGDRCGPGGNDKALYDILVKDSRAFSTSGPAETIKIIKNDIAPNL